MPSILPPKKERRLTTPSKYRISSASKEQALINSTLSISITARIAFPLRSTYKGSTASRKKSRESNQAAVPSSEHEIELCQFMIESLQLNIKVTPPKALMENLTKAFIIQFMSDNLYPNVGDEPLLANSQPPPPPPRQNNTYNAPPPNQPYMQNQDPSFNNYQNPPLQNNPNYPQQPYPPGYAPYNQPQVVASVGNHQIISNNGGVYYNPPAPGFYPMYPMTPHCPICRRDTGSVSRQVPGGVTWAWCFVLFVFTGVCCCIPFCVDSCQDTEVVCAACQCVKARIDANCC